MLCGTRDKRKLCKMPSHCCHIYGTCRSKEVPCEGRGGGQEGCKVIIHGVNPQKGTNFYGGGDLSRHYHGGSHYITLLF